MSPASSRQRVRSPDQFGLVVDCIMENWTEDRPPKMAYFLVDIAWGHAGDDFIPYAEAKGMEIQVELYPMTIPINVLTNKDSGARHGEL